MARNGEETLWSYAKRLCAIIVGTTKGRIWLAALIIYGIVGPVVVHNLLPDGTGSGFWLDFVRGFFGASTGAVIGAVFAVLLVIPLIERRRRRRADRHKGSADSSDG